jgi:hypothetical protein
MLNPFNDVDWNPDRAKKRTFALSLIIGFPCLAVLFLVAGHLRGQGWWVEGPLTFGLTGAAAGLVFLAVPAIVRPFYVVWYALACSIGIVVGNVLFALVFYLFFGGVGLLMRALGRKSMRTRPDRTAPTYWVDAGPAPEPGRYFRQF